MRITDLLDRRSVSLTSAPASKAEALDMAVDLMVKSEKISDREAYRKQVYLREEESTTGIGEGIAIPHRWIECRFKCTSGRPESKLWYDHTGSCVV